MPRRRRKRAGQQSDGSTVQGRRRRARYRLQNVPQRKRMARSSPEPNQERKLRVPDVQRGSLRQASPARRADKGCSTGANGTLPGVESNCTARIRHSECPGLRTDLASNNRARKHLHWPRVIGHGTPETGIARTRGEAHLALEAATGSNRRAQKNAAPRQRLLLLHCDRTDCPARRAAAGGTWRRLAVLKILRPSDKRDRGALRSGLAILQRGGLADRPEFPGDMVDV